jgi:hypothetical protein
MEDAVLVFQGVGAAAGGAHEPGALLLFGCVVSVSGVMAVLTAPAVNSILGRCMKREPLMRRVTIPALGLRSGGVHIPSERSEQNSEEQDEGCAEAESEDIGHDWYEDEDGLATADSHAAYESSCRLGRWVAGLISLVGFLGAVGGFVLVVTTTTKTTVRGLWVMKGLELGSWVGFHLPECISVSERAELLAV